MASLGGSGAMSHEAAVTTSAGTAGVRRPGWGRVHFQGGSLPLLTYWCQLLAEGPSSSSSVLSTGYLDVLMEWHLPPPERVVQESKGKCNACYAPASGATHHHFCHLLLVTQVSPGSVWEGTLQRHELQEVRRIVGVLDERYGAATSTERRSLFPAP